MRNEGWIYMKSRRPAFDWSPRSMPFVDELSVWMAIYVLVQCLNQHHDGPLLVILIIFRSSNSIKVNLVFTAFFITIPKATMYILASNKMIRGYA
jgi:hypothetical protein